MSTYILLVSFLSALLAGLVAFNNKEAELYKLDTKLFTDPPVLSQDVNVGK